MSISTETRRESFRKIKWTLTARQANVLLVLKECGDSSAQEVAAELHRRGLTPSDERNFAAPRLTELADAGLVEVVGKKACDKTGRKVSVWSVSVPPSAGNQDTDGIEIMNLIIRKERK